MMKMRKTVVILLAAACAYALFSCGNGGGNEEPDFKFLTDIVDEEIPYVFDIPHDHRVTIEEVLPEQVDLPDPEDLPDMPIGDVEIVEDEKEPPEELVEDDGACKPQCKFDDDTPKECGPDNCGSICGYCGWDELCVDGLCEIYCKPQCVGKQCGFDGCYGDCPPGCEEGFVCGDDQLCYPWCDHDENCKDKQCGPDGCGGICGECGMGMVCEEETGQCIPHPCGDVPEDTGKCADGNILLECIDDVVVETPCQNMGDYYCNWDGPSQKFICSEGCVPQCTWDDGSKKECGYDGCYGVCGNCTPGWSCEAGKCYPVPGGECGWITENGYCEDNILWFCSNNTLYIDDCQGNGMSCQYIPGTGKFKCK